MKRERHGAVVLLKPKLDVTLGARVTQDTQNAHRVAHLQVLAHEQVSRRSSVLQEASIVPYHCANKHPPCQSLVELSIAGLIESIHRLPRAILNIYIVMKYFNCARLVLTIKIQTTCVNDLWGNNYPDASELYTIYSDDRGIEQHYFGFQDVGHEGIRTHNKGPVSISCLACEA